MSGSHTGKNGRSLMETCKRGHNLKKNRFVVKDKAGQVVMSGCRPCKSMRQSYCIHKKELLSLGLIEQLPTLETFAKEYFIQRGKL